MDPRPKQRAELGADATDLERQAQREAEVHFARLKPRIAWLNVWYANELAELIHGPQPPAAKLTKLWRIADRVNRDVGTDCACRKGCSHCCHQAVAITQVEADRLGRASGRTPAKLPAATAREDLERVEANDERFTGVACPFLKDSVCTVYADRPMMCRTYINLAATSEVCDVVKYPNGAVPNLDLRLLQGAALMTQLPAAVADIRDFFPPET